MSGQGMPHAGYSCRDVCGYPRIVHGGLTAAILDETFGFLFYAMKHHKQLPFWQPAYTAHLEVDYKAVCLKLLPLLLDINATAWQQPICCMQSMPASAADLQHAGAL